MVSQAINGLRRHISQVCVAHYGFLIPMVHGVDGFRELCAACLVNAASVYPDVFESVGCSDAAGIFDLRISYLFCRMSTLYILKSNFLSFPCMRKDRVPRDLVASEFLKLERSCVKQSHDLVGYRVACSCESGEKNIGSGREWRRLT